MLKIEENFKILKIYNFSLFFIIFRIRCRSVSAQISSAQGASQAACQLLKLLVLLWISLVDERKASEPRHSWLGSRPMGRPAALQSFLDFAQSRWQAFILKDAQSRRLAPSSFAHSNSLVVEQLRWLSIFYSQLRCSNKINRSYLNPKDHF